MDGLNLAKELRVFNKSYPTKTPPAEGETPVRKYKYVKKYTNTNTTIQKYTNTQLGRVLGKGS